MKHALILVLILSALPARAAELVVVEADWCSWCKIWEREIGATYDQTPQGQRVPLRRIDIDDPLPSDLVFESDPRATPTFILFKNHREVARFLGYPGKEKFWESFQGLLDQLPMPRRKVSYIRY